jgi:hypothetical protein
MARRKNNILFKSAGYVIHWAIAYNRHDCPIWALEDRTAFFSSNRAASGSALKEISGV